MRQTKKLIAFVIFSCFGLSYGAEHDIEAITTIMDASEQQLDSIKLKYTYETFAIDNEGNREFVRGTFARKRSEGYVLLDEMRQIGKTWDSDKEPTGILRSYNGEVTRYFEHEKNDHGYHMAALHKQHNPRLYKSPKNPYYSIWRLNYKQPKFSDLLNDPNGMTKIQGEEVVDGLKTIRVNFKMAEGLMDCHLWLSPEKNYLPIKCIVYHKEYKEGKQRLQEIHWRKFKEFSGGIWYPMNIHLYYRHITVPTIVKIEEMDISPLTKEDFEFQFPAYTHVTDHVTGTSYVTTVPSENASREESPLEPSLSREREEVLHKYLQSSKTSNSEASNAIDAQDLRVSKANRKEEPNGVPYWMIMLAFLFAGVGIILIFVRKSNA